MNTHGTFAVVGEEGSGKSLLSISKAYEYLINDRLVISNLDIYLDKLLPWFSRAYYIRVPDFPSAADLWNCGQATGSADERKFGLVLLDEIAVAVNAREWKEAGRKELIDYFRQTRKHGFDKFFLSQGFNSIDSQIRNDLTRYVVTCRRTDSFRLPLIGGLLQTIGFNGMLPKIHLGTVKPVLEGKVDRTAPIADRWTTRGPKWYGAYDTKQKFTPYNKILRPRYQSRTTNTPVGPVVVTLEHNPYDLTLYPDGVEASDVPHFETWNQEVVGIYCVLSAWHLRGRYLTTLQKHEKLGVHVALGLIIFALLFNIPSFYNLVKYVIPQKEARQLEAAVEDKSYSLKGVLKNGKIYILIHKDGSVTHSYEARKEAGITYYIDKSGAYALITDNPSFGSSSASLF